MLVLTRKPGEKLLIGNGIVGTLLQLSGNKVRIGIEAPERVRVLRGELACWLDAPTSGNGDTQPNQDSSDRPSEPIPPRTSPFNVSSSTGTSNGLCSTPLAPLLTPAAPPTPSRPGSL
jgi:carbon storage regulator